MEDEYEEAEPYYDPEIEDDIRPNERVRVLGEWGHIPDFPDYMVSDQGEVHNVRTNRYLQKSRSTGGALTVNLYKNGRGYQKSVKSLVAETFVPHPPPFEEVPNSFGWPVVHSSRYSQAELTPTTPIQLDGDETNVRADNLVWRTRSFAWNYKRQFLDISDVHLNGPELMDEDTHEVYACVYDAAVINGLLFKDIWRCLNGVIERVHPTQQRFVRLSPNNVD